MEAELSRVDKLLAKVQGILQGEPLRVIVYIGAIVIYLVAKALAVIPDQSLDQAIVSAGAAGTVLVTLVESARKFTSSPKTVERIEMNAAQAVLDALRAQENEAIAAYAPVTPDEVLGTGEPVAEEAVLPDGDARIEALPAPDGDIV